MSAQVRTAVSETIFFPCRVNKETQRWEKISTSLHIPMEDGRSRAKATHERLYVRELRLKLSRLPVVLQVISILNL